MSLMLSYEVTGGGGGGGGKWLVWSFDSSDFAWGQKWNKETELILKGWAAFAFYDFNTTSKHIC